MEPNRPLRSIRRALTGPDRVLMREFAPPRCDQTTTVWPSPSVAASGPLDFLPALESVFTEPSFNGPTPWMVVYETVRALMRQPRRACDQTTIGLAPPALAIRSPEVRRLLERFFTALTRPWGETWRASMREFLPSGCDQTTVAP